MIRAARLLLASLLALVAIPAAAPAAPVELASLGAPGFGAGRLSSPSDVSISPVDGVISVADKGNNRISQFAPGGAFIRAFGWDVIPGGAGGLEACTTATTCKAGTAGGGAGELGSPFGLAQNAQGTLYVTQVNDARVSLFTQAGDFLATFGWDVEASGGDSEFEVCKTDCKTGVPGDEPSQFDQPTGIDTDPLGRFYVANRGSGFVAIYSIIDLYTGRYAIAGPAGAADVLSSPEGVELVGTNLWVADTEASRITRFSAAAGTEPTPFQAFGWDVIPGAPATFETCTEATTCQVGAPGTALGQFDQPSGIAITGDGRIAVSDRANPAISRLSPGRQPLDSFGPVSAPAAVEADCRGALWIVEPGAARVRRFGEPGTLAVPCTTTPPPGPDPTPTPNPDFTYKVLKIVRDTKTGTAKLSLRVSAKAKIELRGDSITAVKRVAGPGTVVLPVRARGNAKRTLNRTGRAKIRIGLHVKPIGFPEDNGSSRPFTLKKAVANPNGPR